MINKNLIGENDTSPVGLNQCFEILGLLHISRFPEFMSKEYLQKASSDLYVNAEELYHKYSSVYMRYVSVFQKKMVKLDNTDLDFFEDEDSTFTIILQVLFAEYSYWLDSIETVPENDMILAILNIIADDQSITVIPSLNDMIKLIQHYSLSSPAVCWKLILLLQEPKKQLTRLSEIIKENVPAYESALSSIEKPLSRLLKEFPYAKYKITTLIPDADIIPTLIHPVCEIYVQNKNAYIGLYTKELHKELERGISSRSNLLTTLKALSDSSKFEILLSLKHSPKYNLELAEQLGLSAATMSHHMNVLLTNNLVSLEKREGRVYYTLTRDTIEKLITDLRNSFIN